MQLEQKLDGILSLLKANQSQSTPECPSPAIPGQDQVSSRRQDAIPPLLTPEGSTPHGDSPGRSFTPSAGPAEVCSPHTTDSGAEEVLNSFRNGPLEYLPFVYIPDSVSAAELKTESPFLWYCICAVQCKHTARQSALSVSIREKAAQALLVDCRKNLDILQGLLVYLGWYLNPDRRDFPLLTTQGLPSTANRRSILFVHTSNWQYLSSSTWAFTSPRLMNRILPIAIGTVLPTTSSFRFPEHGL